jgi:hypothetical protein
MLRALVLTSGISGVRYTLPSTFPVSATLSTGSTRPIIRGHMRQLCGFAGEALTAGDRQQIRSEFVNLFEQPSLARGGQAEHRDDRGDPDRDPERR